MMEGPVGLRLGGSIRGGLKDWVSLIRSIIYKQQNREIQNAIKQYFVIYWLSDGYLIKKMIK